MVKMNSLSLAFVSVLLVAVLAAQEFRPPTFNQDVESSDRHQELEFHEEEEEEEEVESSGISNLWREIGRQYDEYCDDRLSFTVEFMIVISVILFAVWLYYVYYDATTGKRKRRSITADDDVNRLELTDDGKLFNKILN